MVNFPLRAEIFKTLISVKSGEISISAFYISANWHYFSGKLKILRFHKKNIMFPKIKRLRFRKIIGYSVSQIIKVLPVVPCSAKE
jgi:hypothetical protein